MHAQETGICGTLDTIASSGSSSGPFCFDFEEVWENGLPIYVNVNVHFFLNDDCTGSIHPNQNISLNQRFGFEYAEDMINKVNDMMELMESEIQWNQLFWGVTVTDPRPTHFRFILSGVYLHCNTTAKLNTNNSFNHAGLLGVQCATSMNIFMVDLPGEIIGITTSGFNSIEGVICHGLKSQSFNECIIGHELGHKFGLAHTFDNEFPALPQCEDTWNQPRWYWDKDCNGTDDSPRNNDRCWSAVNIGDTNGNGVYESNLDINMDSLYSIPPDFIENYCHPYLNIDSLPPCYRHPCCDYHFQNNNIMAYSSYSRNPTYTALTPCQIDIMMQSANTNRCDFVEQVDGSPPPSAFISILPYDDIRTEYCSYCLRLEASVNDALYNLDIYDGSYLLTTTGWLEGPAENYCIKTTKRKDTDNTWFGGFLPNHNYTAILTVENTAGSQATYTLPFTTPATNCQLYDTYEDGIIVTPNPAYNSIELNYTLPYPADIEVLSTHSLYGTYPGVIASINNQTSGNHILSIDITAWHPGINYLIIQIDDEVYSSAIFKQ